MLLQYIVSWATCDTDDDVSNEEEVRLQLLAEFISNQKNEECAASIQVVFFDGFVTVFQSETCRGSEMA